MYEFSIIASGLDPQARDFETRFFDAGCDDATVSFQEGRVIIDFAREAGSADAAISSAVEQVLSTGASVDRIEPNWIRAAQCARTGDERRRGKTQTR